MTTIRSDKSSADFQREKSSDTYYHGAGANGPIAGAKKEKHGKPAHREKPRLNPALLALHMQQAKNPPIRCIEEPRQPRSDSVFPLQFSRN